jgi:hypothetical protein
VRAAAWWALAMLHLLPGVAALVAPEWFAAEVAGLPTDTAHFVRDVGVAELTLAVAAGFAAVRESARRAVLVVLSVHLALHAGSHVVDAPALSTGGNVTVAVSLLVQAILLALAARRRVVQP